MLKRIFIFGVLIGMALVSTGCAVFLIGAGAGGTVLWQGGKVISEENASMTQAVSATKAVFKAKKINLTTEVTKNAVVQLRGEDTKNTKIAVDIFEVSSHSVRIEIRVGLGEDIAGRQLLAQIKKRL